MLQATSPAIVLHPAGAPSPEYHLSYPANGYWNHKKLHATLQKAANSSLHSLCRVRGAPQSWCPNCTWDDQDILERCDTNNHHQLLEAYWYCSAQYSWVSWWTNWSRWWPASDQLAGKRFISSSKPHRYDTKSSNVCSGADRDRQQYRSCTTFVWRGHFRTGSRQWLLWTTSVFITFSSWAIVVHPSCTRHYLYHI